MTDRREADTIHLVVDPVACEAVGVCAYLARHLIELDRWGYPLVPVRDLRPRDASEAGRAARACPRRALHLVVVQAGNQPKALT